MKKPEKVLEEVSRVLAKDGKLILGLILKESPWAQFYMKKGEAGNVFYKNAAFHSFNELKVMLMKSGLTIIDVCSTISKNQLKSYYALNSQEEDTIEKLDL